MIRVSPVPGKYDLSPKNWSPAQNLALKCQGVGPTTKTMAFIYCMLKLATDPSHVHHTDTQAEFCPQSFFAARWLVVRVLSLNPFQPNDNRESNSTPRETTSNQMITGETTSHKGKQLAV